MGHKTVLVTGGAGYVGSHACAALAQAGYQPVVYDNLSRGHEWAVKFGPLEVGDIMDSARLAEVFARHKPVGVMHFAAHSFVGESVTDPAIYYRNNVYGSLNLLQSMIAADVRKIVFSSTCAVYGIAETVPLTEKLPLAPVNPYGASKWMVERILADFAAAYGLTYAALRYFNAAGGAPDLGIGEAHDPETHLVPLVLDAAAGKRKSITIFGIDYPTPDGSCIRDYIHVLDLASAHIAALERLVDGAAPMTINLGNGAGYSVREVIAAAEQVTGRRVPVEIGPRRAGDPPTLIADASHARSLLGWIPQRPAIATQLQDAWSWHQQHHLR
ncbi:MAG TPA: UDP-glucose 4-epimerase GalE [Alphaproteobacteria bacterium]